MRPTSILFVILLSFICGNAKAQDKQNIEHKVTSKAFEKERKVRVFLPERYFRDSTSSYLVVYVLDAHDDQVWNMATGVIDYMVSRYTVIPMMAVGIASENRGSEFNPNSDKLHQHFKEDVFPLIESKYRTKQHRTIVGHSWGGAFVGNTLFSKYSDMFDAYIAISPSFMANNNVIYNQADSLFQLNKDFRKFVYFSAGTVGFEEQFKNEVVKMDSVLTAQNPKNLIWKHQVFEGKDHFSGLTPGLNDGLVKMSRNYFADQKIIEDFASNPNLSIREQVNTFNARKMDQFGFVHKPNGRYYKFTADEFKDKNQNKAAVEVYGLALKENKDDVSINFGLADAYDRMGNQEMAKQVLTKTLAEMEKQKKSLGENFYKNMKEWAIKKLDGYKK